MVLTDFLDLSAPAHLHTCTPLGAGSEELADMVIGQGQGFGSSLFCLEKEIFFYKFCG